MAQEPGTTEHPLVSTFGATLGGAQKFGDLTLALHGTWDRTDYQSVTGLDLASDDFNDWGLRGRVSYRLTEAISPFVELDADARRYDSPLDYTGYDRNSDGWQGLAGATLAFTRLLTGEASFGYGARSYADARLPNFGGPLVDASLIWSVTPLTTVTGKAQTTLGDAVVAGASGAITRTYSLDVAHELTRAVTLGATASWAGDNYVGVTQRDSNTTLALRAEYHISRDLVLKASASRQAYHRTSPVRTISPTSSCSACGCSARRFVLKCLSRHCEQSEAIQTEGLRPRLRLDRFAVARDDGGDGIDPKEKRFPALQRHLLHLRPERGREVFALEAEGDVGDQEAELGAAVIGAPVEAHAVEGLALGKLHHAVGELDFAARPFLDLLEEAEDLRLQNIAAGDDQVRGRGRLAPASRPCR